MTDSHIKVNDSQPRVSHTADGVATAFAAPFPFLEDADLSVWIDGQKMSLETNYTVAGAGDSAGGTVSFLLAPEDGATVVIARDMGISRTSDFLAGSALRAAALNTELDTLTMVSQELQAANARTIRAPMHDAGSLSELPDTAQRAGRFLSFDTGGNPEAGPLRSSVDLAQQIANAEAGAVAAATSAEAAAAVVAAEVAAVDTDALQANHQAALRAAPYMLPVTFPGVPVLAHHRDNLVFAPTTNGTMHTYRPTDSGAWHINASSQYEQWFDLSHLGIGQEFKAAVRHGGTGSIVIAPGTDQAGGDNVIGPFAAGENFRIHAGESIVVVSRSTNTNGGYIGEVVAYSAAPEVTPVGLAHRLVENALGLHDGDSQYNLPSGFYGVSLPSGYCLDTGNFRLSFPLFNFASSHDGQVDAPRIHLAGKEYTVTYDSGDSAFGIGDTLTADNASAATLRVDHITHEGKLGLTLLTGSDPVAGDRLTSGDDDATIDAGGIVDLNTGDLPGGLTAFVVHNPNTQLLDLRVHWRNLEKI